MNQLPTKLELTGKYAIGKVAIVDAEDFESLNKHKWYVSNLGYVRRGAWIDGKNKIVSMHREVLPAIGFKEIDHINRDKLDNRKSNLRPCNRSQNNHNTVKNKSGDKYKGVYFAKRDKKWAAMIGFNRKRQWLGYFKTELEAVKAYDLKAKEVYGEHASLNFK